MKLHHIAIAAAFAAAGTSSFATDFYLSGSSALQKVVVTAIGQNCSNVVTYNGVNGSAASGPLDNANGQSYTRYTCTAGASNTWAVTSGTVFDIYMNTQGSAYGVFPVASNAAINFINPTSCTASGNSGTCTGVTTHAPDAGLSDLEPTMFNDASNHPVAAQPNTPVGSDPFPVLFSGQTVSASSFASSKIAATQTFGLAVNPALYAALQADQNTTGIPTVSSAAFATIYSPGYALSGLGWKPLLANGIGGNPSNQVNICSRLPGSGTRASAQALFLQLPFSKLGQSFATTGDNTNDSTFISDSVGQNNAGGWAVGEYDNSGAVTGCLTSTVAGGYAIGLLSTDRAPSGYSFVNLDGSLANASAAKNGQYQWVYEAYFQVNKAATANKTFANAFYASLKTPANINKLGAPSTNGVMAAVANCPSTTATADKAVCAHVSRGGDARAALLYVQ